MQARTLITDHPVAIYTLDHSIPRGTLRDNYANEAFNDRLVAMFPSGLSVLDLGCSGGGFVRSLLDRGIDAFGIEGSDWSKAMQRANWLERDGCPDHLATADITKPFHLAGGRFRVVTAWDVLEHIAEHDLPGVFDNIDRHCEAKGLLIFSISPNHESISEISPDGEILQTWNYHQTVQPKEWWVVKLAELGWRCRPDLAEWFGGHWVRDETNAPGSFHLVLERA